MSRDNHFYLEKLLEGSADNQIGKKLLQSAYVDIANATILLGKFKEAEKAAEKSLALEAASIKALSKMAAALLYQGKFRKASEIYTSWKDKPYESDTFNLVGEFFLHDLESYEEAGITHPDLQKIRQLF